MFDASNGLDLLSQKRSLKNFFSLCLKTLLFLLPPLSSSRVSLSFQTCSYTGGCRVSCLLSASCDWMLFVWRVSSVDNICQRPSLYCQWKTHPNTHSFRARKWGQLTAACGYCFYSEMPKVQRLSDMVRMETDRMILYRITFPLNFSTLPTCMLCSHLDTQQGLLSTSTCTHVHVKARLTPYKAGDGQVVGS